jgi:hypothetical protein
MAQAKTIAGLAKELAVGRKFMSFGTVAWVLPLRSCEIRTFL